MKKIITTILLMTSTLNLISQNSVENKIKELYDSGEYNTIINEYASTDATYSAKSLYYIGTAYMMTEDDINCIKYMDLSILKDSLNPAPFYDKASSFLYLNKLEEAIPVFQKSISLDTISEKIAASYRGLGYAYYYLEKYDLAIDTYRKAIEYDQSIPTPYIMIAQVYSKLNQNDKALEAYYEGKNKASKKINNYTTLLFNIGLKEQKKGNYAEAESAYSELVLLNPDDHHALAKLIQVYYHYKEYDKAKPLKERLYNAHEQELIEDENLSDMFCIDQFKTNGISIKAFERYEDGDIEYRIQTEYSPAAVSLGTGKYILCANTDERHINYGIVFDDNSSYDQIKNAVISILNRQKEK